MEDKNKQLEPKQVQPSIGCGSLLASARKQQKKSVEEIADELNLSISQIKTIELDQSEGLPEPTYVRGYIRSYAKLLGLDAEEVLESYLHPNWQKSSSLDDIPRRIGNADEESKRFLSPIKVIVFLVLVASITFLWKSGLLSDLVGANEESSVPPVVVDAGSEFGNGNTQSEIEPVQEIQASDSVVEELSSQAQESANIEAEQSEVEVEEAVEVVSEELINDDLTLTFSQTCWVDVRDSKDNRLAYKSYAAGDVLTLTNEGKLHVFLGNAEGVTATYKGKPYDISSYREGVYAKFSLVKN